MSGSRRPRSTAGSGPAFRPTWPRSGRPSNGRTASFGRPTRSCARQALILRRRSSTAGPSHDRLHRRSSWGAWGRADLQGLADRPLDLPRPCRQAARSSQAVGPRQAGCRAEDRGSARVRRELPGLWRAQGLAAAQARRLRRCPLYRGATDAGHGFARGRPRQTRQDHDQQQGRAMPAGSRQPTVQGAKAERSLALRLHLCRDLERLCLCRLRHRRLCPQDRWLAGLAHAGFVLDGLEQALHDPRPVHRGGLVHHSDRGSQYVSIKYTERLAEAGVEPSVGSVGDSYDNALAETINGLYKAEVIHRRGPWRSFEAVEFATLEWVDWFNNRRLLEPIGNIPPAEAEQRYYAMLEQPAMAA